MDRWDQQRIGDRIADWTAALSLGLAGGVVAFAVVPAAARLGSIAGAAIACTLLGLAIMRRIPAEQVALPTFDPVPFDDHEDMGELLLDTPYLSSLDDELILDDPIAPAAGGSRVVRLFAPETIAAPGELADRIDSWLEGARGRQRPVVAASGGGLGPTSSPASAALHAALDDLRRSLR
jgi:hypothetical protein